MQAPQDHLGVPVDDEQQVVEVVRDASREPPNGLEPLGLPDLALERDLLGDVPQ
jgi:hypothetical protein